MAKKYEVEILEKVGSCDNGLFEKMAKRGDITSRKLAEVVGCKVQINGYAMCKIITDEKEFVVGYYDTEEYGLVSSGSQIFNESVKEYLTDTNRFTLAEVKTKKGKTYKAVPVLNDKETKTESTAETNDDLPF